MSSVCKCGKVKSPVMEVCGVCLLSDQYSGKATASFTKHCEKHNLFYSSDLECPECGDWQEEACKNIQEALSKQFEPQQSSTGSLRFNKGKPQTREIDPNFIMGIAEVLTKSREKYDAFNWAKSCKLSTPYESLMRHLMAFQSGEDIDPEDGMHHLLKVATNVMFMYYHITNNPEESDDRFFKKNK